MFVLSIFSFHFYSSKTFDEVTELQNSIQLFKIEFFGPFNILMVFSPSGLTKLASANHRTCHLFVIKLFCIRPGEAFTATTLKIAE